MRSLRTWLALGLVLALAAPTAAAAGAFDSGRQMPTAGSSGCAATHCLRASASPPAGASAAPWACRQVAIDAALGSGPLCCAPFCWAPAGRERAAATAAAAAVATRTLSSFMDSTAPPGADHMGKRP